MSSRAEQKAAARRAREEAEAAEATRAKRARRIQILGGLVLVAIVAVGLAIALTGGGDDGGGGGGGEIATTVDGTDVVTLTDGIRQDGLELGSRKAAVTLEEFIDPQCPYCKQFSNEALPTVIEDYVRPGKVKLILHPLAFIGEDSVEAARAIAAASAQNKAWTFLDVFYANQGPENSGYVTEGFLRDIGAKVPGLDVAEMMKDSSGADAQAVLDTAQQRASAAGANSTPTLLLRKGSGSATTVELDAGDYVGSVTKALDAALGEN